MRPRFLFLLLGLTLSILFSSGQIENPDTHLRLTQTRIIVDEHRFGLAPGVGEDSHGNIAVNDSGVRYMVYNPGQTVVFIPLYYIAQFATVDDGGAYYLSAYFVSFINYMVHALSAYFLFKIAILLGATKRQSYITSLFFGITSYSFVFAQSTYEHHFEMLFILASFYVSLCNNSDNVEFLPGFMLSFGLIFRSTTILALPSILLLQRNNRLRFKTLIGLSPGIAFVLFYNYYRFSDPLESGYSLAWSLANFDIVDIWSFSRIPTALFGFLFSPGKGVLFFSSTILLSFLKIRVFCQRQRQIFYSVLVLSAAYLGLFSMNFAWHGSIWSYGPRYILPIIPLLYLPMIYVKPNRWIYLVMIFAFICQIELISVNYKRDVLADYIVHNGRSEMAYLYSIDKEPHFVQGLQLTTVLPKNFGKLNNYQPYTPWKKEIRTASSAEVIDHSIEKNAINFWWIRIFHWNTSRLVRAFSIFTLVAGLFGAYILFKNFKNALL